MSLPTSARAEWSDSHEAHGDNSEYPDCPFCEAIMEEQDDIQEDTTSMEEKIEELKNGASRAAVDSIKAMFNIAPEGTESPQTRKSVNIVQSPEMPSDRQIRALCWHLGQAGYNDNHDYVKERMTKSEAQSILSYLMKSNYEEGIAQLEYLANAGKDIIK